MQQPTQPIPFQNAWINHHVFDQFMNIKEDEINLPKNFEELRDDDGHTLLHWAVFQNKIKLVDNLLNQVGENKEFINIKSKDNKTALIIAVEQGRLDIVKKLYPLSKVNISAFETEDKQSSYLPIHIAALNGNIKILEYLVKEEKEDVNMPDNQFGYTPLHFACQYNQLEMVNYLINELNANINIISKIDKLLPIHIAILNNNLEIVKALVHYHVENKELKKEEFYLQLMNDHIHLNPLYLAIINSKDQNRKAAELTIFLINELNADYSKEGNNGVSALHLASEQGNCELINFLIENKNEDVNQVTDITNETPLYLAAINNQLDAVKLLISKYHAKVDVKNSNGKTILNTLKEMSSSNEVTKQIIDYLQQCN
ncbi:hypothetical protein ABK040_007187 [Willaertia magna]